MEAPQGSEWRFEDLAVRIAGFRSPERAWFRCRETFRDIPLQGRSLLEIGAGAGLLSAYAAFQGAGLVVALEPEAAGSTAGIASKIVQMRHELGARNFEVLADTIRRYDNAGRTFDIVLSFNSVNHLDEPSCIALSESEEAREAYRAIFRKIAGMMNTGGRLILADSSRYNLFPLLGLKAPLARNIEWHKHQSPGLWQRLLAPLGFVKESLRWYRFYPLRHLGCLAANRLVSCCLTSSFRLVMRHWGPPHG